MRVPYLILRRWNSSLKPGSKIVGSEIPESTNNFNEINSIIKKFIHPKSSKSKTPVTLSNDSLISLYNNWKLVDSEFLPLTNPTSISPYHFQSTYNSDLSYIKTPRLAVTKLLTDRWCELREYYTLYAGSPPFQMTKAVELGLGHHTDLEHQLHVDIDTTTLSQVWERIINSRLELLKEDVNYSKYVDLAYGNVGEGAFAASLSNQAIGRMFSLLTTSQAREVLVHGYLNLKEQHFINTTSELLSVETRPGMAEESKVLVSGIVDHFQIANRQDPRDLTMFQEVNDYMEYEFTEDVNGVRLVDLTQLFEDIPEIIHEHAQNYSIRTSDVKTRSFNRAPHQPSILNAAKYQTFYYKRMLELLAQPTSEENVCFGYHSLLENAKTRGLDIDKPISLTFLVLILRKHHNLLYHDFTKLAQGQPIGFELFDEYATNTEFEDYDVQSLIRSQEIDQMCNEDDFDYHKLLTPELLTSWKVPPTIRYFAARSYQFYTLFADFVGDQTRVEYHNGKTGVLFHSNNYQYDSNEMNLQISLASKFWNGDRQPNYTTDISKCKNCTFSTKCLIPNEGLDDSKIVGRKVHEFLHSK